MVESFRLLRAQILIVERKSSWYRFSYRRRDTYSAGSRHLLQALSKYYASAGNRIVRIHDLTERNADPEHGPDIIFQLFIGSCIGFLSGECRKDSIGAASELRQNGVSTQLGNVATVGFYRSCESLEGGLDPFVRYLFVLLHERCRADHVRV